MWYIPPLLYTMIGSIVVFYSLGIAGVCGVLNIGFNILALVLATAFAVAAIVCGYMLPKFNGKLEISLMVIAGVFLLCAVVFIFLRSYSMIFALLSGLFFSIAMFIILVLMGNDLGSSPKSRSGFNSPLFQGFCVWFGIIFLYIAMSLVLQWTDSTVKCEETSMSGAFLKFTHKEIKMEHT
nr:unnamed protein product [Trichobilharzia regenti]